VQNRTEIVTAFFPEVHFIQLVILGKTVWAGGQIGAVGGAIFRQGAPNCFAELKIYLPHLKTPYA